MFSAAVQFVVVSLCVCILVGWKMSPEILVVQDISFARIIIVLQVYYCLEL